MKKRTKISLRTKIYLTIVGLLALTGIIYAVNPIPPPVSFSTVQSLTGVAVSKTDLFTTGFAPPNTDVYTLDCAGVKTTYQMSLAAEKYIAIAPAQSVNSRDPLGNLTPFTPRDIFVTYGDLIFKATPPGPNNFAFFAQISCSETDHTGITFDKVGTFGNDMIVTCKDGGVFRIDGRGGIGPPDVNLIASLGAGEHEGPVVAPTPDPSGCGDFGQFSGQILVADEENGVINSIENLGPPVPGGPYVVHPNIFGWIPHFDEATPEALAFVPCGTLCTYCTYAFFQTSQQGGPGVTSMFAYLPTDFNGLGGSLLVTLESDQRIVRVAFGGGMYFTTVFDNPLGFNILEGSSFVDCDIPTPTPTSTPTATFTPTATATATFTPTPTATATFTPTPTATATATPTPTPTPTAPGVGCTESTSISTGFNAFPIASGNYLWFSSVLKAKNLPSNATVTVTFTNQTITIPGIGSVPVPAATVMFVPGQGFATTTDGGTWTTTVPSSIKGNTFLSGLSLQVPGGLPGSIRPVTWSGTISIDTPGVSICWQWAAANYPTFSANGNALGIKSVDDKTLDPQYQNADHAGTPENFKQFVVGGGTGGGGSNYTGSLSGTKCVCQ